MAKKITKTQKEANRILRYLNKKEKEGWVFDFIPEVADVVKQDKNGNYTIRQNASYRTLKKLTARLLKIGAEKPDPETGEYLSVKEVEKETRRKAGLKGTVTRKKNKIKDPFYDDYDSGVYYDSWDYSFTDDYDDYDSGVYYDSWDYSFTDDYDSYVPSATYEIIERIRSALESYSPPADWDRGYADYRQKGVDYLLDVLESNIASYGEEVVARRIESANLMVDDLLDIVAYESNSTTSRNALLALVHAINGSRIGEYEAKNIDGYLEANE